jgi:hypothetical protein
MLNLVWNLLAMASYRVVELKHLAEGTEMDSKINKNK